MESTLTDAQRRARITAEIVAHTGIDEAMIERLMRRFYEKIREDALLAPIFEARIADWEPHLRRMCEFWSSVAHFVERARRIAASLELGGACRSWQALYAGAAKLRDDLIEHIHLENNVLFPRFQDQETA